MEQTAPPSRNLILFRSLGYGWLVGGVYGALWGGFLGFLDSGTAGLPFAVVGFLIGAVIGALNGLVLGTITITARETLIRHPRRLQIYIALISMVVVFVALWVLTGDIPLSPFALFFLIPAGVGAWLLFPATLRPRRVKESPTLLPGKSES